MPALDREEECFKKWSSLIKADKIGEISTEAVEKKLTGQEALECVVYISQLAYKDAQNGVSFSSSPEDIVRLTEVFCAGVVSQPSLCNLRFITSLYHIAYFFYRRDHLVCVKRIFRVILKTKQSNINSFQGDGSKIYDHFILLLKKMIPKVVTDDKSLFDHQNVSDYFSLLLDLMVNGNALENGSTFLETVLYASQVVAKQNKNSAVILISKGLQLFSEVEKIRDVDSSLTLIFKLYSSLFHYQLSLTGYASALGLVLSYIKTTKWKFCEESVVHGECFYLLCQAKMFMSSQPERVTKMIHTANTIFEKFQNISQKKDFIKEACSLIFYFIASLQLSKTISISGWLGVCSEPFLEMVLNMYNVLKNFDLDKLIYLQCLSNCYLFISKEEHSKKQILKDCLNIILKTVVLLLDVIQTLRSETHPKADWCTKLVLTRCANLIHSYHLSTLHEEIVAISKPVCKFICSLPLSIFDDTQNKSSLDLSFTCLIQALGSLGSRDLYEILEVEVAWLLVCPQSSDKIFRLWGDLKHNAICDGGSSFLDTTVLTIVIDGKESLEKNWLTTNLTSAELGNLLVKELNTYFVNSSLRGSPLLQAAKALESLKTDILTQVRGVVVALDLTTARSEYVEQCRHYYNRSEKLLAILRKQKNHLDPVVFILSMAELLFAQFRFQLRCFRSDCEGEVLRLSARHKPANPLVAELPESRPDPNDTCDVTSSYTNLSLAKQQEVLAGLHNAVTFWGIACSHLKEKAESENSKYDLRVTLKNLQEAAMIMKLYCDGSKEDELWRLLYNFACLVGDVDKIVLAVGELLKTEGVDQAAIDRAKENLNKSELTGYTKNAFLLNMALLHLTKNEIAEGVNLLKEVMEERKKFSTILYINCLIVLGLYQKCSSWTTHSEQFALSPSCHFSFHKALSNLLYLSQQEKWNSLTEASHIQLNLLRVSSQLGEINWSLEQPRETRCYVKSQLFLAQKLGLPLRTVQLLLVLAWVDLYTGVMDDCKVKLEELETLLALQGTPSRVYMGDANSPLGLNKAEVKDPEFLSHRAGCDCFVCRCAEYKRLVLETLTLRATFCVNNNLPDLALQSFKVAFRVHKHLCKSDDVDVQTSSARMWKHYADASVLSNKPQDKLNINKKALNALPSTQEQLTLLQHILHQQSSIQSLTFGYKKPVERRIVLETEKTESSIETPVKKCGRAALVPAKTPLSVHNGNITPKFARPVRKLTLPSSGEENTPPLPKSSPKSKRRIKPPQKFMIETPQAVNELPRVTKTPFTIVDDDGNAVGVSSSKMSSRVKKKPEIKVNNVVYPINKKLFESNGKSPNENSVVLDFFKSPERKSKREPKSKTYGSKKSVKNTKKTEITPDSEVFTFEALKEEVDQIKSALPKSNSNKSLPCLAINKELESRIARSGAGAYKDIDSDSSVVEGTPSPPKTKRNTSRTLKPRRATRSNKT